MSLAKKLAHSANPEIGVDVQYYDQHVINVWTNAVRFLDDMEPYVTDKALYRFMKRCVVLAAIYHDLGKLDEQSQSILARSKTYGGSSPCTDEKMINHVDAGVACLLQRFQKTSEPAYAYAAFLVHAHHIGLQNFGSIFSVKQTISFTNPVKVSVRKIREIRDTVNNLFEKYKITEDGTVSDRVDRLLPQYIKDHNDSLKDKEPNEFSEFKDFPVSKISTTVFRIMLSVLVDADHTDTTLHYGGYCPIDTVSLQATKRLEQLDATIAEISSADNPMKEIRNKVYSRCRNYVADSSFSLLDGCVGVGKTFSGTALCLRTCEINDLRRMILVAPFCNLISQITDRLQSALELSVAENFIDEVHMQAEYDSIALRKYSKVWANPIVTTTAVQYIETLGANRPSRLRKLHRYVGSVTMFDEYHKMMSYELWPTVIEYLKILSEEFSCHFIFSSGTSVQLWETSLLENIDISVSKVIVDDLYREMHDNEKRRCKIVRDNITPFLSVRAFCDFVETKKGSKLIIMDTVWNSILVARELERRGRWKLFQISTIMTSEDRKKSLRKASIALRKPGKSKVIIVATSCMECGHDISVDVGFREECTFDSVLQIIGRVDRNFEQDGAAKTYVFKFDDMCIDEITSNPRLTTNKRIMWNCRESNLTPEFCTVIAQQEINQMGQSQLSTLRILAWHEANKDFPSISSRMRVIDSDTTTLIIDKNIVEQLRLGDKKSYGIRNLYGRSVQIWTNKLKDLRSKGLVKTVFENIPDDENMFYWDGLYDSELYGIAMDPDYAALPLIAL